MLLYDSFHYVIIIFCLYSNFESELAKISENYISDNEDMIQWMKRGLYTQLHPKFSEKKSLKLGDNSIDFPCSLTCDTLKLSGDKTVFFVLSSRIFFSNLEVNSLID